MIKEHREKKLGEMWTEGFSCSWKKLEASAEERELVHCARQCTSKVHVKLQF